MLFRRIKESYPPSYQLRVWSFSPNYALTVVVNSNSNTETGSNNTNIGDDVFHP